MWPNVTVHADELRDLKGVIDAQVLETAFPEKPRNNKTRCEYDECAIRNVDVDDPAMKDVIRRSALSSILHTVPYCAPLAPNLQEVSSFQGG